MAELPKKAPETCPLRLALKTPASDTHLACLLAKIRISREFAAVWGDENGPHRAVLLTKTRAYIGRDSGKIAVYDLATKRVIREIAPTGGSAINHISQSMDETSLFIACESGTAMIIDMDTGNEMILRGHTGAVRCVIQGNGSDVLTCSVDNTIRRWNSATGKCTKVYRGHTGWVTSILYDEATKRIFSASGDKTVIVWNDETGEKIGVMGGHTDRVLSLSRVTDTTIASGACDGTVRVWDMATFSCINTMYTGSFVFSITTTPDRQHLIVGLGDCHVDVVSVETGKCLYTLTHHTSLVHKVAISPSGRLIASCGLNGIFHLTSVFPPFS